jgi:hypothetical protein
MARIEEWGWSVVAPVMVRALVSAAASAPVSARALTVVARASSLESMHDLRPRLETVEPPTRTLDLVTGATTVDEIQLFSLAAFAPRQ